MRIAERRGLLRGNNLSPIQEMALDFLGHLEERDRAERRLRAAQHHQDLMIQMVKAALVATGRYEEKAVFEEHFPPDENQQLGLLATSDADVDLDYSGVEFGIPEEDELAVLQHLLGNDLVQVDHFTEDREVIIDAPTASPPSTADSGIEQIDTDREWV